MFAGCTIEGLSWRVNPLDVLAAWPRARPLVALHSGRAHPRWARWSVLAAPAAWFRHAAGRSTLRGRVPGLDETDLRGDALADLDVILDRTAGAGAWIGGLSYELGGAIEPAARAPGAPPTSPADSWPLVELAWCPRVLVYDHVERRWLAAGPPPIDEPVPAAPSADAPAFSAEALSSNVEPDRYLAMVARTIELIRAGDIFQANISHRLRAAFAGSTRALAVRGFARSLPWYGAYLELPGGRCVVSLSPELFLEADLAAGVVTTRPIKGTRPASRPPQELRDSAKDAAELHMIVDLARNDLGRVCRYGSVQVPEPRSIESHPTVHHGVARVTGRLREGVSAADLLRATFPAGSITGAPKIRAMQIIEALEGAPRGPYCGSIGFAGGGRLCLNVGIRTIAVTGRRAAGRWDRLEGTLEYGAGGGIVADSDPPAEYAETLDKAAVLEEAINCQLTAIPP